MAQVDLADNQAVRAQHSYENALKLFPGNPVFTLGYSRSLLLTGQADKARRLLEEFVRRQAPNPALYKLLADAEIAAGQKAAAHQALAEHYYLNGQTIAAIEQLQSGIKASDADFYRASQMEARLKELQDQAALESKR